MAGVLRWWTAQEGGARRRDAGDARRRALGSRRHVGGPGDHLRGIAVGRADAGAGRRRRAAAADHAEREPAARCGTRGPRSFRISACCSSRSTRWPSTVLTASWQPCRSSPQDRGKCPGGGRSWRAWMSPARQPQTRSSSRAEPRLEAMAFDPLRVATAGAPRAVVAPVAHGSGAGAVCALADRIARYGSPRRRRLPPRHSGLAWWSPSGFQAVTDEVRRLRGRDPLAGRHAGRRRQHRRRPGRRLDHRRAPRHRHPPDPQRHQFIPGMVGRWPDRLLRVACRRRVRVMEDETRRASRPRRD